MTEYVDIDGRVVVTDTRGRELETTVRHILEFNKGVYTVADVVERKRGKWIDSKCSECGGLMPITKVLWHGEVMWETDYPMSHFCPNCGADMRGRNDGSIH